MIRTILASILLLALLPAQLPTFYQVVSTSHVCDFSSISPGVVQCSQSCEAYNTTLTVPWGNQAGYLIDNTTCAFGMSDGTAVGDYFACFALWIDNQTAGGHWHWTTPGPVTITDPMFNQSFNKLYHPDPLLVAATDYYQGSFWHEHYYIFQCPPSWTFGSLPGMCAQSVRFDSDGLIYLGNTVYTAVYQ